MDSGRRLTGHLVAKSFRRCVGRLWAPLTTLLVPLLTSVAQAEKDLAVIRADLDSPLVIDVRSGGEFELGSIDGAINVPVQGLPGTLIDMGLELNHKVIVYCRSGRRSAKRLNVA